MRRCTSDENNASNDAGKTALETRVEIVSLSYEARILNAVIGEAQDGLYALQEAVPVREQIAVVRKLAGQAVEMVKKLDGEIQSFFKAGEFATDGE